MKYIDDFKKSISGLPKSEKIICIQQTIVNITPSHIPLGAGGALERAAKSEHGFEIKDLPAIIEQLKLLLSEVQNNPEAYQSNVENKALIPHIYDRSLDWYLNTKNVPNHSLVFDTIEYFETGKRKGFFEPLEFLNLLKAQLDIVEANADKPHSTVTSLKALPLSPEEKHVLLVFIIKWLGDCIAFDTNQQYNVTLKLIEKEFLSYEGDTPEKELYHRNWLRNMMEKQDEKSPKHNPGSPKTKVKIPYEPKLEPSFRLKSNRRGLKVDLIRILNAIHELEIFEKSDGLYPTKGEFMQKAGDFFGLDLSNYTTDLSQALDADIEQNLQIFKRMEAITQEAVFKKLERKTKH